MLLILSYAHALDIQDNQISDALIHFYENYSTQNILSLADEYLLYLNGLSLDQHLAEYDPDPKVVVHFVFFPYDVKDISLDNLSNKYIAIVLSKIMENSLYSPEEILICIDYHEEPDDHILTIYSIDNNNKSLFFDYSGRLGIIREEFRWNNDAFNTGDVSMQTRVIQGNIEIIGSFIKGAMSKSYQIRLKRSFDKSIGR